MIERLPNSFRYRVTELGFPRPGLAAALPGLRAIDAPFERTFDQINAQISEWINQAQLAA